MDNMLKYHNELCWQYPISDGKHLGTYIALVKEGVLSLPYNDANKVDASFFVLKIFVWFGYNIAIAAIPI